MLYLVTFGLYFLNLIDVTGQSSARMILWGGLATFCGSIVLGVEIVRGSLGFTDGDLFRKAYKHGLFLVHDDSKIGSVITLLFHLLKLADIFSQAAVIALVVIGINGFANSDYVFTTICILGSMLVAYLISTPLSLIIIAILGKVFGRQTLREIVQMNGVM